MQQFTSDKERGLRLSLTNYGKTITFSSPYDDEPIEDIIHAFYSLMIGVTWSPEQVITAMSEFVEEHTPVTECNTIERDDS